MRLGGFVVFRVLGALSVQDFGAHVKACDGSFVEGFCYCRMAHGNSLGAKGFHASTATQARNKDRRTS